MMLNKLKAILTSKGGVMTKTDEAKTSADIAKMRLQEALEEEQEPAIPYQVENNLKSRAHELAALCLSNWLEGDIPILAMEFFRDFKFAYEAGVTRGRTLEAQYDTGEHLDETPLEESQAAPILKRLRLLEIKYEKLSRQIDSLCTP